MSRYDRLRQRLPSMYRPESGDLSLMGRYLATAAESMNQLEEETGAVMRAHWLSQADRTEYHPYYLLKRQRDGLSPLRPGQWFDLDDLTALKDAITSGSEPMPHLRTLLSPALVADLSNPDADAEATTTRLISELQRLPFTAGLYKAEVFAGVDLPTDLTDQLTELGSAADPTLNRQLLRATFKTLLREPVVDHFYLEDLTRLGALLGISPLREPTSLRESAESFRLRLRRMVRFYRNGVGTLPSLRLLVEALLPVDMGRAPQERDRPFLLEPFPTREGPVQSIQARDKPLDILGPLMRWQIDHQGLGETSATVYMQGVTPVPAKISATLNPMIERVQDTGAGKPLGLAYEGLLAPDETLRLRPAMASWLGLKNGPRRSRSLPQEDLPANPTAPGPWNTIAGAPAGKVIAFYQGPDRVLWLVLGGGTLLSYNGSAWQERLTGLGDTFCMAGAENYLLVGTRDGVKQIDLFPQNGVLTPVDVAGLADKTLALHRHGNDWWIGQQKGLMRWTDNGLPHVFGIHEDLGTGVLVGALCIDRHGLLFAGTSRGLFQYQSQGARWFYYAGGSPFESDSDWKLLGEQLPQDDEVFLPEVTAITRGFGSDLWLGTTKGLARYRARPVRGTTYETVLEAFPDLGLGRVEAIVLDPRQQPWFATERGLLRHDGRDLWYHGSNGWKQLGAASSRYDGTPRPRPRGTWRFRAGNWESFSGQGWLIDQPAVRIGNSATVYAVCFTPMVVADLGTWDGVQFQHQTNVVNSKLKMRYKPTPDRIVDGGIPAIPAVRTGKATWRYLRYQPDAEPAPAGGPAWNCEGRLVTPPSDDDPWPGRYLDGSIATNPFLPAVFAFDPAARLWMTWPGRGRLSVLVRLQRRQPDEILDKAIIDRVWDGLQQFRPAGVSVILALDEQRLRGV